MSERKSKIESGGSNAYTIGDPSTTIGLPVSVRPAYRQLPTSGTSGGAEHPPEDYPAEQWEETTRYLLGWAPSMATAEELRALLAQCAAGF